MKNPILIVLSILILVVLIGGGVFLATSMQQMPQQATPPPVTTPEPAPAPQPTPVPAPTPTPTQTPPATSSVGKYIDYSESSLAGSLEQNDRALLFFHAAWCPTCRAAEADIKARPNDLPEGIDIVKVDYDTQQELKNKYGIFFQHTFVEVDENLNELQKWYGGEVDEIVKRVG